MKRALFGHSPPWCRLGNMETSGLTIWTVYDNPRDMPDKFIARKWINDKPTDEVISGETLEAIRDALSNGLTCLSAQPGDDPVIVETWF